jgi:hypothetical protein
VGSEIVGGTFNGYPSVVYPGMTTGDNFDARGERIIGADPMPSPTPAGN